MNASTNEHGLVRNEPVHFQSGGSYPAGLFPAEGPQAGCGLDADIQPCGKE